MHTTMILVVFISCICIYQVWQHQINIKLYCQIDVYVQHRFVPIVDVHSWVTKTNFDLWLMVSWDHFDVNSTFFQAFLVLEVKSLIGINVTNFHACSSINGPCETGTKLPIVLKCHLCKINTEPENSPKLTIQKMDTILQFITQH